MTGQAVLNLLHEQSGMTWMELCDKYGYDHPNLMDLLDCMQTLTELGLVSVDGMDVAALPSFFAQCVGDAKAAEGWTIRTSEQWRKLKHALHYDFESFERVNVRGATGTLQVSPIFGRPKEYWHRRRPEVFVLMPFYTSVEITYSDAILPVAADIGLRCVRADNLSTANAVMHDIWDSICASRIIISDCTGRNPNVFYELGIAHTIGKKVILITQNREDVPFDIRHMRYIEYICDEDGLLNLKIRLRDTIMTVLNEQQSS